MTLEQKSSGCLRFLWAIVLSHAIFLFFGTLFTSSNWFSVPFALFFLLSVIGGLKNWGPTVACTLAGFYFGLFWCPSPYGYAHNSYEVFMEDFGIPAICAGVGLVIGGVFDFLISLDPSEDVDSSNQKINEK
jgi:hypothetical protein